MDSDPFMPTGSSRRGSTRTTSPLLCSPRSKEDFYSPRCNGVPARSRLRSIPFSPLPSANEPKPGSFAANAEVGLQHLDEARASAHSGDGGRTELPNLVLLCHRHDWSIHEGGWQLVRAE